MSLPIYQSVISTCFRQIGVHLIQWTPEWIVNCSTVLQKLLLTMSHYWLMNKTPLAIASSGIAATLLDEGRTAHSAFKPSLNIQNNSDAMCNIKKKKQSSMAIVLKHCKIITWHECTMADKHSLEALNRTLKDIKNNDRLCHRGCAMARDYSLKIDEKHYRSHIFEWQIPKRKCFAATHSNDSHRRANVI